MLRETWTWTARRSNLAAAICCCRWEGNVVGRNRRLERRAPLPHVQTIETADKTRARPDRKNEGTADPTAPPPERGPERTTDAAKSKMTDDIVVKMVWAHQENHDRRCNCLLAVLTKGEISTVPSSLSSSFVSEMDDDRNN